MVTPADHANTTNVDWDAKFAALRAERDAAVQAARRMVEQVETLSKDRVDRNARIQQLEQAAEQLEDDLDRERANHETLWRYQRDRAVAAEHAAEQARNALQTYGEHLAGCVYAETLSGDCTCGLTAALAGNQP